MALQRIDNEAESAGTLTSRLALGKAYSSVMISPSAWNFPGSSSVNEESLRTSKTNRTQVLWYGRPMHGSFVAKAILPEGRESARQCGYPMEEVIR